jgi:hypothetical protein
MNNVTIVLLRAVIALALAGSVAAEILLLPAVWTDLDGAPAPLRLTFVALLVLGVAAMQVFGVCVWILLTRVRAGSVFSASSLVFVDVIVGAIAVAAGVVLSIAILLAPGGVAPGVIGLLCGAALVLGGVALLVVVMKALLRQATALRAELDEVV